MRFHCQPVKYGRLTVKSHLVEFWTINVSDCVQLLHIGGAFHYIADRKAGCNSTPYIPFQNNQHAGTVVQRQPLFLLRKLLVNLYAHRRGFEQVRFIPVQVGELKSIIIRLAWEKAVAIVEWALIDSFYMNLALVTSYFHWHSFLAFDTDQLRHNVMSISVIQSKLLSVSGGTQPPLNNKQKHSVIYAFILIGYNDVSLHIGAVV
jgi:hypothetical protein